MQLISYKNKFIYENYSNHAIFNLVIIFGFLYQYIGPFGFLSYLIAIFGINYKFKLNDLVYIFFIFLSFIVSFFKSEILLILISFRYHFGFIIFYYYFRNNRSNLNFYSLFILLLMFTFIEMVLVNSLIDPRLLPNYPVFDYDLEIRNHFSIDWQRVYGFAGNASILATLLVVIYSIINTTFLSIPLLILILFIGSGVGLISMLLFFIVNLKKNIIKYIFFVLPFLLLFAYLFYDSSTFQIFRKFLSTNFLTLIDTKTSTLIIEFNKDLFDIFFGNINADNIGGDFAWVSLLRNHGLFGVMVLFIFIISKCNKYNIFPIFLLVFTSFHYYTIFSLPGQILTGFLLSFGNILQTSNK